MKICGNIIPLTGLSKSASTEKNLIANENANMIKEAAPQSAQRTDALNAIVQELDNAIYHMALADRVNVANINNLVKSIDTKFKTNLSSIIRRKYQPLIVKDIVAELNKNIAAIANAKGKGSAETNKFILELAQEIDKNFGSKIAKNLSLKMPRETPAGGAPAGGAPTGGTTAGGAPTGGTTFEGVDVGSEF